MKSKSIYLGKLILMAAIALSIPYAKAQDKIMKKRIAVFVFDDKTDRSQSWWYRQKGVGEGLSDMLVTELVKSGNYRVIERAELDAILKEQDLGASGVVTAESAAQIGKVLGVELAVVGAVTEFGMKDNTKSGSVSGLGLGVRNMAAVVGLDCRIVNTTTAEILSAEDVRKSKSATGISVNTRKFDFRDQKDFDESLIGKASREAVEDVIRLIEKHAPEIPWQAKVIMEQTGKVFINAGKNDGIDNGDKFVIYRAGTALIDPDTGLSLGSTESKVGEIQVSNNNLGGQGKAAECNILNGTGFLKGDVVRQK